MKNNLVFQNIVRFIILMLIQVVLLNHVRMGGYITPMLYVLFLLMLPTQLDRMWMLVIGFLTGLTADIFSGMVGYNTAACTLVAFLRVTFADKIITNNDDEKKDTPSFRTAGFLPFTSYSLLLLFTFHFVYFNLLIFCLRDMGRILLSAILSTVATWLLALLYQSFLPRREKKGR